MADTEKTCARAVPTWYIYPPIPSRLSFSSFGNTYVHAHTAYRDTVTAAMSVSSSAAKVAPKTLNQFRNFSYIVVAWLGFNKGFREKAANDAEWIAHQQRVRQQNVERHQAASAMMEAKQSAEAEATIPAIVPEGLHEVYKDIEKAVH
ncbi:hypothetical protein, conserved [Leishmania tarentolae]|uniref:Uncharacterized protein n=1 Tax=Leishmania tarentolae TaxID=5689 RepID=A0A640KHE9_LEITA|nr:hypothetical protein, conserved [Leishmania tarentolae]